MNQTIALAAEQLDVAIKTVATGTVTKVGKKATDRTDTVRETLRYTEVDVDKGGDVPTSGRTGGAKAALLRYSGAERRVRHDPNYSGAERRSAA